MITWLVFFLTIGVTMGVVGLPLWQEAKRPWLLNTPKGDEEALRQEQVAALDALRDLVLDVKLGMILPMVLVGLALVVSGCTSALPGFARRYASNGERIYYSGASANDQISYSGGTVGDGMMGGGMMGGRLACADCHGQNAQGGVHFMHMTTMDAPDIRWSSLTGAHEETPSGTAPGDHGHAMDHDPYTPETFALAVRTGVDPGGQPLDRAMPRWQMSDRDISDLIDFLQTVP